MFRLLKYLKKYKVETILGPLFKLMEASFELLVPLVMASIIDNGIEKGDKSHIFAMGGVLFLLAAVGFGCAITAQYFAAKASVGFATNLRHVIFNHIQTRSYEQMDEFGTSTMMNRLTSDVNQVQTGVNLTLRLLLRSPFIVFGAMVMAFTVDVKGAMIFVVTIPILAVVVFAILLINIPLYKKVQKALDKVVVKTRENLTGVRVVRAFSMEREEVEGYDASVDVLKKFQLFAGRVSAFMNPVTFMIVNGATLVLLYRGAVEIDAGFLTQGALIALVNYMAQILVELIKLANLIITITKSMAGGSRIADMLYDEEDAKEVLSAGEKKNKKSDEKKSKNIANKQSSDDEKNKNIPVPAINDITFENVSYIYKGASSASVSNLSFRAKKGDIVGVIGGTGSGKTSLINLLAGFYEAKEGRVLVNGEDITACDTEDLRARIGIVPQTAVLFKGTIEENLKWGKADATEEEMWEALELARAKEFVEQKTNRLKEAVLQGGKNFSGGQRQRLCMARAFVRKPDVLILDDSTSALDYATESKVRQGIRKLTEDAICFIVSQRAASIMDADLLIVLDEGEVAGMGTHEELLKSCEVYAEIYYSQFPEDREEANNA
ncbi:MAG: ABC transporter ATP-binding protein [Lachnospiraceae bacterium]|nr:ABC transporter ATP-binding protein [Lachnospiraceae bacterium]